MLPYERHEKIVSLLREHTFISIKDLLGILDCSQATLQRDLTKLEEDGLLTKTIGGAKIVKKEGVDLNYSAYKIREMTLREEKKAISELAQKYIEPREVIFLSHGTTTSQIASNIDPQKEITIVTNGLDIANILESKPNVRVLLLGGFIDYKYRQVTGPVMIKMFEKLRIEKLVLGAGGVTIEDGISFYDFLSVEYFAHIVDLVKKIIVPVDHSKIGRNALTHFLPLNKIDILITDDKADINYINKIRQNGVTVELAKT